MTIEQREQKELLLCNIIRSFERVTVAFSGGADSTYLLAVCADVLGANQVVAVIATSPTLPTQELEAARALATHIGVHLEVIVTNELDNPDYVRNDINRCFHCQQERFASIWEVARTANTPVVVYGATAEDVHDHRPGFQAARLHGVRMPLLEANLWKEDIRELSRQRNLSTHDKPSMACLASRIPYGTPIRIENLEQVAEAELFLHTEMGLRQVRVRHYDNIARIEVECDDIDRVVQPAMRERIVSHLQHLGFTFVTLDLAGFQSGSMNQGLNLLQ